MKDIIKACLALIMVIVLAIFVFYNGDTNVKTTASKSNYTSKARVDVYTPYEKDKLLEVVLNDKEIQPSDWSKDNEWYTVQSDNKPLKFTVKANKNISATIDLKGPWDKGSDEKFIEHWVAYSSVKVNGKEILTEPQTVWHNKTYKHTINFNKGTTYQIEAVWEPK